MPGKPKLKSHYPYYLANRPIEAGADLPVLDKYSGKVATRVAMADAKAIDAAIGAAAKAAAPMAAMKPYQRRAVLEHCVEAMRKRKDELAYALCVEAGKPIKDSQGEAERLIDTFRIAADESTRIDGEIVSLEISERTKGYRGFVKRVPLGPCSFITPFNFPLNLVAHKRSEERRVGKEWGSRWGRWS